MQRTHLTLPAAALAALLALAGCTTPATPPAAPAASTQASDGTGNGVLASLGLTGLSGPQIVEKLDHDPATRPLRMKASVRPDQVILGDGTAETSVPLAGAQEFYLSIAPFVTQTHDCYFHSLATCQGELPRAAVHVTITDSHGAALVDTDATTYANGFVGFWLPRDISGTVTITTDGKTGSVPFATGPQDATCLTTLRVA